MVKCNICNKDFKRMGTHMLTHRNEEKTNNTKPEKDDKGISYGIGLAIISGIIVIFLVQPALSQFFINYFHWTHFPISELPLENTRPRIELIYPQNLETFEYNETVILWATLSDEGGTGIDYKASRIELQKGVDEIALENESQTKNKFMFRPKTPLKPGRYTMRVIAQDGSRNTEERISDFYINEKPMIKLEAYPAYPVEIDNQTYAKFVLRNTGLVPLVDFEAGFIDPDNHTTYSWAKQKDNLLLPGDKTELHLPVKLNLSCDYIIHSNNLLFTDRNISKYYNLVKNTSGGSCMHGDITLRVFSFKSDFKTELGPYRYPFYEGEVGIENIPNSGVEVIEVHDETEIQKGMIQLPEMIIVSPDSVCAAKPGEMFESCYNKIK